MGELVYGRHHVIEFDDSLLAHLQIVIGTKLRRREGLLLSWSEPASAGGGTATIWLDPAQPLIFRYENGARLTINRERLQSLTLASNSPRGLVVGTPEA